MPTRQKEVSRRSSRFQRYTEAHEQRIVSFLTLPAQTVQRVLIGDRQGSRAPRPAAEQKIMEPQEEHDELDGESGSEHASSALIELSNAPRPHPYYVDWDLVDAVDAGIGAHTTAEKMSGH